MNTIPRLSLLLSPLLIAACAATAPPAKEFPAGARAPSAAELTTLLRGKSTNAPMPNGGTIRVDYAADSNALTAYIAGRTDSGTWRVEDGRICYELKTWPSACNEARLVGQDLYTKRANGDVVPVTVGR
ncbi:MAG: DUF995 domain-containing protein [Ottowia sp.]|uniref:DUF995 domain-containing protein n=1 Tax=Ottowia sp. TaxID=1898956 RepID=UPI0039E2E01B